MPSKKRRVLERSGDNLDGVLQADVNRANGRQCRITQLRLRRTDKRLEPRNAYGALCASDLHYANLDSHLIRYWLDNYFFLSVMEYSPRWLDPILHLAVLVLLASIPNRNCPPTVL